MTVAVGDVAAVAVVVVALLLLQMIRCHDDAVVFVVAQLLKTILNNRLLKIYYTNKQPDCRDENNKKIK